MVKKIYCTCTSMLNGSEKPLQNCHCISDQSITNELEFVHDPCRYTGPGIYFNRCIFFEFPSADIIKSHGKQTITTLIIKNSKISKISADDLKGFGFLKELCIAECDIESLPGDLFMHTPNLESVSFRDNKIKYIGETILKPLQSLKYFNLTGNDKIDYIFNTFKSIGSISELQIKLIGLDKKYSLNMFCEIQTLQREKRDLEMLCSGLKFRLSKAEVEIEKIRKELKIPAQKSGNQKQKSGLINMKVNGKVFKASKKILIAQSKTIAKLVDENPDAECFELTDISENIFNEIIMFLNTKKCPTENANLIEIFSTSCALQIDSLSLIVSKLLEDLINPENVLEILVLCKKYKNFKDLENKAYVEYRKCMTNTNWALEPENMNKINLILGMPV